MGALLLCSLGAGNWVIGDFKLAQYQAIVAHHDSAPERGVTLRTGFTFSNVNEGHERHNIALAKVQYYGVVVTSGEVMVLVGVMLLLGGGMRSRVLRRRLTKNKTLLDSS